MNILKHVLVALLGIWLKQFWSVTTVRIKSYKISAKSIMFSTVKISCFRTLRFLIFCVDQSATAQNCKQYKKSWTNLLIKNSSVHKKLIPTWAGITKPLEYSPSINPRTFWKIETSDNFYFPPYFGANLEYSCTHNLGVFINTFCGWNNIIFFH